MKHDQNSAAADRRPMSLARMRTGAALAVLVILAGCAGAPPPRLYLLSNEIPVPAPAVARRPLLVVRSVAIPEYLDRRAIIYRSTEAELKRFPDVIWAERLNESLTRWVTTQLAADLPAYEVEAYAAAGEKTPAVALYLAVQTFEPDAAGGAATLRLRGTWHLNGASSAEGRVSADVPMTALDAPSTVAAMRTALVQATDSIAAQIQQVKVQ